MCLPGEVNLPPTHLCHQQATRTWEYPVTCTGLRALVCKKGTLTRPLHDSSWLKQGNDYRAFLAGYSGDSGYCHHRAGQMALPGHVGRWVGCMDS